MATPPATPLKVFISYSHKDERLQTELVNHLRSLERQNIIAGWHDRLIKPGTNWAEEIDTNLDTARLILLLVSSDFIASDYCYSKEMQRALERHEAGETRLIPIILRPVYWDGTPIAKLQALPKNAKPITKWNNRDEAFADVTRSIAQLAHELRSPKPEDWIYWASLPRYKNRDLTKPAIAIAALIMVLITVGLFQFWQPSRITSGNPTTAPTSHATTSTNKETLSAIMPSRLPPSPTSPLAPSPTPRLACTYTGATDGETIRRVIQAEAEAANTSDPHDPQKIQQSIAIIKKIFAPNAIIRDAKKPGESTTDPVGYYEKLYAANKYEAVEHSTLTLDAPGIVGNTADYTGVSKGRYSTGGSSPISFGDPPPRERWKLSKASGCWLIVEFTFNLQSSTN